MNCTDGEIRLYDGSDENEGILHVCMDKVWTTVCYNSYWNAEDTRVACKELGYTQYGLLQQVQIYINVSFNCMVHSRANHHYKVQKINLKP